jgi:RNA polymerase sigma-70 factor, ECF subfamily
VKPREPREPRESSAQDERYQAAVAEFGPALERLAQAYEANPDIRRDLLQDIHLAIWRSFGTFDRKCSLRTWVYRIAHNTAASHVNRAIRFRRHAIVTLEELEHASEQVSADPRPDDIVDRRMALEQLYALVQQLDPLDRQVMVCYLDGMEASAISEIIGVSGGAVAMKIHRIKRVLAARFQRTRP